MQQLAPEFAVTCPPALSDKAPTLATLFSCGGLFDIGAMYAGFRPIWGVEYDPGNPTLSAVFADTYERNIGAHVKRQPVQEVDFSVLPRPDALHASPVCKNFSIAKSNAVEVDGDITAAEAVCRAIASLKPQIFTLENVRGYVRSRAYQLIRDTLYGEGYGVSEEVVNTADYGVPQSRVRLIVRAILGQFPPPTLPLEAKMGWYEALADLIPNLPESVLAQWQRERLSRACSLLAHSVQSQIQLELFIESRNRNDNGRQYREASNPSTVTDYSHSHGAPLILVERSGARNTIKIRTPDSPAWTIKSAVFTDQNGANRNNAINILLESGKVLRLTPRAIARLQTVPDWYELPEEIKYAGPLEREWSSLPASHTHYGGVENGLKLAFNRFTQFKQW